MNRINPKPQRIPIFTAVALGALLFTYTARAQIDHHALPDPCGSGVTLSFDILFADGVTLVNGPIAPCETIVLKVRLASVLNKCCLEGGTLSITGPGGFNRNITPPGGIPLLCDPLIGGSTTPFVDGVPVTINNVVGGTYTAVWVGTSHEFAGHPENNSGANTPKSIVVQPCPPPGPCQQVICDPNVVYGVGNSRKGRCVTTDLVQPTCSIAPNPGRICAVGGSPVTFNLSIVDNGGAGAVTVTWTGPAGFTAPAPGDVRSITTSVPGHYNAHVSFANGCQTDCGTDLTPIPNPSCVIAGPAAPCRNTDVQYTVTTDPASATVQWSFGGNANGASFVGSTTAKTVTVHTGSNPGGFELVVVTTTVTSGVSCSGECRLPVTPIPCNPVIAVLKEVACVQPGGTCPAGGYAKTATGVRDGTCPAFCYRITVSNPGDVPLVNITLSDPSLDLTACNAALAGVTLQPGQSTTPCITGPVEHCADYVNTVIASGASSINASDIVKATNTASVVVKRIDVTCDLTLFSSFSVEGPCDVNLPQDSVDTPVTFILTVCNTGNSPLNVTSLDGLPVFEDCLSGAPATIPVPFSLVANECRSFTNCTRVSCPEGARYSVTVHAQADDANGTLCVYDNAGNRVSDESSCQACVGCAVTPTCRVTGGGQLIPGFVDQSCIEVATTIFPFTSPNGLTIKKITHGGQLGAPFSQMDCGIILGNPCIRGQWQHTRHYEGQANPRDVFDMDFHSQTPKGQYDSLSCACLGCCDPGTGAFIPPSLGPLIHKFALCNPDDHKVCGPQPRPAPANAIIWSGIGKVTPVDDVRGSRAAQAEWVVFRVYIEDRSEPGGGHPKGAVEPADIYCFQAWKTGIKVSKKPDFSAIAAPFRTALGAANCKFLEDLEGGVFPIGTLPSPIVDGVTADIQDCGPMHDGNHQIHPATGATCTQ
jgi:hypothetical protein